MIKLETCPVCKNSSFSEYLECKDHFLTRETFLIVECNSCHFRFTNPRPKEENNAAYYKSQEYISHSNVKGGLLNSLYHNVRNYTITRKYKIVNRYASGNKILDIGCGTGQLLHHFKNKGWDTMGIEPDEGARKFAIDNYHLQITDLGSLISSGKYKFDVIMMWHVLEHVNQLDEYLQKIKSILHENGTFIVAVPNSNSWDAGHYKSNWAAYDVPRHLYHFDQGSINNLMEQHMFKLEKTIPMKFDAYYISLLSEKYRTGKENFFKGFWNGFYSNSYACLNQKNYSSLIFIYKIK
ncbi:MAG: class I SAM-dependent methyltransferase [Bacteroidota bacterium]|nr:class I SAM-dependent methyltransferase [Bacteroidota bacterium]